MINGFIDGDFSTGKQCKHHCSPTCHPGQTGPEWRYGCLHPGFPDNKQGDFCPLVDCGGEYSKCELITMFDRVKVLPEKEQKCYGWTKKRLERLEKQVNEIKAKQP